MRLRSVWISEYKNLKEFSITFEGDGFIDILVGKNGSGKSNFLEALIKIFDHVFDFDADGIGPGFDYRIQFEIADANTALSWRDGVLTVNGGEPRRTIGATPLPHNVLVYYSGQNDSVSALVSGYEARYRARLRRAEETIIPRFVGIGPACKKLLIVILMLLPDDNVARQFLCAKLGILSNSRSVKLVLKRPPFAAAGEHDPFAEEERFWGAKGPVRDFLEELYARIEGDFTPGSIYDREKDQYILKCDLRGYPESLGEHAAEVIFRSFDALRVAGMFEDISINLARGDLEISELNHFSDGQFQSVYLFAVSELFKRRNCITLLDEPDAFLHPEWQFDFLEQVSAISAEAAKTNHILLSSHSASTVAAQSDSRIHLFSSGAGGVTTDQPDKTEIVRSLSAGLITFSEREASLNIERLLANTSRPVLFTEGVSDAEILRIAWAKLNAGVDCPFEIIQCFDCGHLRKQLNKAELYQAHPGRLFLGLFDFDEAYGDWARVGGLKAHQVAAGDFEQPEVELGLACKRNGHPGYAMLLPVPVNLSVRGQVCNAATGQTFGERSRLTIEQLFRDVPGLESHFAVDSDHPAQWEKFIGNKVEFAQEVVPNINAEQFEAFRPIFDFVQTKSAEA